MVIYSIISTKYCDCHPTKKKKEVVFDQFVLASEDEIPYKVIWLNSREISKPINLFLLVMGRVWMTSMEKHFITFSDTFWSVDSKNYNFKFLRQKLFELWIFKICIFIEIGSFWHPLFLIIIIWRLYIFRKGLKIIYPLEYSFLLLFVKSWSFSQQINTKVFDLW